MLLVLSADFFKIHFSKKSFKNTISMSNNFYAVQDRFVGADLGPDCLQRLSAEDKDATSM